MSRSLMRRSARAGAAPASSSSANVVAKRGHRRAFGTFIRRTRHYSAAAADGPASAGGQVIEEGPGFPGGAPSVGGYGGYWGPFRGPPCLQSRQARGVGEALRRLGRRRDGGHAERGAAVETEGALDGHHQLEVQRVARVTRYDVARDAPAEQREVAKEVEHLVAHELVAVTEAVEGAVLADDDRVVERAAERAPALAQEAEILEESVGARGRVLGDERLLGRRPGQDLRADRRVLVVERVGDAERVGRHDLDPAAAGAGADRMRDADGSLARALRRAADGLHELHERLGAAVGRRQLGAVDTDVEVVDAEAGRRRHQVLDRLDPRAVLAERGGVVGIDDALGRGGDGIAVLTDAEDDAGIGGTWGQRHANSLAAVQPNTFQADRLTDGVLSHDRAEKEQPGCHTRDWGRSP